MADLRSNPGPNPVEPLFEAADVGGLRLRNRFVMAPMTRAFSPGGVPGPNVADYYARRAAGGIGLIITEGTFVPHPASSNNANIPNFHGDSALAGWREVVRAVHAEGAKILPQLWHVGLLEKRVVENVPMAESGAEPVSPSGHIKADKKVGEPMTVAEIERVIMAFGEAAKSAVDLGFDGIEIHGAHGYLIDQFLWAATNRRTDEFGGDLVSRTRFAAEIVRECRRQVGPSVPIVFRFSQWKQQDYAARLAENPSELEAMLSPLVDAGVDIFHTSQRRFWQPEFAGSERSLAGWTKAITGKPAIIVGSVGLERDLSSAGFTPGSSSGAADLGQLLKMFGDDEFDLVAVGRALIGNPNWCDLVRRGEWNNPVAYSAAFLGDLR
jgi:2,4-dienoyl-CoA reductase-like NADH-dependent reductase (Old Yellow Enzyme family)